MIAQNNSSEQISDRLMAEQLTAVMRNFSVGMLACFCNTLVFVLSSMETHAIFAAMAWAIAIWSILSLMILRQWRRRSVLKRGASNSRRGIQHLRFYALTL